VDGFVAQALSKDHVAGVSVAIVQNGQIVLEKAYGGGSDASGRRINPRSTLVRLGSASQIFTWIAVLKALDDGRLALTDPVNQHLPDPLKIPDEGFDQPVRIWHLMSHTGGFESRTLGRRVTANSADVVPLDVGLVRWRPRRVRAPGLVSVPSAYGAALAGEIVARAEKRPFDQLIEAEIINPLGLAHTSFREPYPSSPGLPEPLEPSLAQSLGLGYRWSTTGLIPQPVLYAQGLAPGLSASTTTDDMARLMAALLNGGRLGAVSLFKPTTAALMTSPLTQPAPQAPGMAHGLAIQILPGGYPAFVDIGGSNDFQAGMHLVPKFGLGVFVSADTNTGSDLVANLAPALVERFYGTKTLGAPPSAPLDAPRYEGVFLSADRAYHGLEAFVDRLTQTSVITPSAAGDGIVLRRGGHEQTYRFMGQDAFRADNGQVLVVSAPHGRAQGYMLGAGAGAAERVGGVQSLPLLAAWAGVTALTALISLASLAVRDQSERRETRAQTAAGLVRFAACAAWLIAFGCFAWFARRGVDLASLAFAWPSKPLIAASWAAVAASLLSITMLLQMPGAWREERRILGWSGWRKIRHLLVTAIFLTFAAVLAAWGGLEPWSS